MRTFFVAILMTAPLMTACASSGQTSTYQEDLKRLEAACTERQGILTPTGLQSGRPETEYACRITGGASRIPPR
ncbi:hypothetical protein GVN18_36070 [Pseudomonas sp. ODNR1LW]|nr:hypothetical protein [Pseudomonas sp. ODNR1LW]